MIVTVRLRWAADGLGRRMFWAHTTSMSDFFKPRTKRVRYGAGMTTNAATGPYTQHGTPTGYTSITPFLTVSPAEEALAWYRELFDARIVNETIQAGVTVHAELQLATGRLQIGEPSKAYGTTVSAVDDLVCFSLGYYCSNVDELCQRAESMGATVRAKPSDFVSGDRYGSFLDPFRVRWNVMTRIEDLSDEASAARVAEWAAKASPH